jgi:hypothetical protein
MPPLDNQNTITLPGGKVIVLAPGSPDGLTDYYGLHVAALWALIDEFDRLAQEACRARNEAERARDGSQPTGEVRNYGFLTVYF